MTINLISVSGIASSSTVAIASGLGVVVQSGVYLASGLYVVADIAESGMGVQVQSGIYLASGLNVVVQSGLYLASGLFVASGIQVDSAALASESAVTLLRRIAKLLEPSDVQDHMQRQQVRVDDFRYSGYVQPAFATLPIVGAVSGVSVVSVVTNVQTVGVSGICGNNPVLATTAPTFGIASWQPSWTGPVENRWFMIDQARASYAAGIRKNIWVV